MTRNEKMLALLNERLQRPNIWSGEIKVSNEDTDFLDAWIAAGSPHEWEEIDKHKDWVLLGDHGYGKIALFTCVGNDIALVSLGDKFIDTPGGKVIALGEYYGQDKGKIFIRAND